jgi:hypothetical protein
MINTIIKNTIKNMANTDSVCKSITKNGTECNTLTTALCKHHCSQTEEKKSDDDKFAVPTKVPVPEAISAETLEKNKLQPDKYEYITMEKINPKFSFARVGVVEQDLFHTIAFLQFFNEYNNYDLDTRILFINNMKKNFFSKISSENWIEYVSPEYDYLILKSIIDNINKYLQSITPSTGGLFGWFSTPNYTSQLQSIIDELLQTNVSYKIFRKKLATKIKDNFQELPVHVKTIEIIVGESTENIFSQYKESILKDSTIAGIDEVNMISKEFGINIFVFGSGGELYFDNCTKYDVTNPSIIVYHLNSKYWEPIVFIEGKNSQTQTIELPPNSPIVMDILEKYGC